MEKAPGIIYPVLHMYWGHKDVKQAAKQCEPPPQLIIPKGAVYNVYATARLL